MLQLNVNGQGYDITVAAKTSLSCVLRNGLDPLGTKFGCGIAVRGTYVVQLDGKPVHSLPASLDN